MSDSLRSHGLQPPRLLRPWDFPGKSTGMGSHFLLQGNLPDSGIEPGSPALQADALPSKPPGKPQWSLSHIQFFATLCTVAHQGPQSMGFFRQEYWSGFPFLPPGDLPDPGIEPGSPSLQVDSLPSELPRKPSSCLKVQH